MKETIAMLLAGGQGSRLYALTQTIAKPAVPYGGKYRIIDFPLSNCINSGIDTVGVLTQYQPLELNAYIGDGRPWDLDRLEGGVHVLSPYQKIEGSDWYRGTANAIYQNFGFIEKYNPEYVLILSGDHIYKMNYSKMVDLLKKTDASVVISVLEVPKEEASRFGIMNTDKDDVIIDFEEKPEFPKSNLASMGIYLFRWDVLNKYLEDDNNNPNSSNDFGKDVIPALLNTGKKLVAYRFEGYWKDVGTIDSLWEANMDLINPNVPFDIWADDWRIYCRNPGRPPQYVSNDAVIQNSIATAGSSIDGNVDFSVIFDGVEIHKNATVRDSIIMPGSIVEEGAEVHYSIIAEDVVIKKGAKVGERPENMDDIENWGVSVVAAGLTIGEGAFVRPKAMVYDSVGEGEEC
ncbi:MAG: glucose-1-phosphate adenylyltransferase [Ruminococcaceae bacterium]|nr:glucose-1-phosphate adenylyltransferase [Oscillospiraceae bacterium]